MKISYFLKGFVPALLSAAALICMSACGSGEKGKIEYETGTVRFNSDSEAYEAMTGAVNSGDYNDAVRYYASGAAGAGMDDSRDWYYYAMAERDFETEGCVGYPLELAQNMTNKEFYKADALVGKLQLLARDFNGAYSGGDGNYIYFADGKIAASQGTQLSGNVVATGELATKDGVYYWVKHNVNAQDEILYKIEPTDRGFNLTPASDDASADSLYVGTYEVIPAELPHIYY